MAIEKLVPRYLNKEDDVRLVKNVEMTDALNVRISADQDGNAGVIKNAYGNDVISGDALPAGTNKVIGSVADNEEGQIFFFVWNSNNDHSIFRYTVSSNSAQLVYQDSVLSFSEFYYVRANVVKNITGESILYFTDGNTSPKKLNTTKALLGLYPSAFTSGTDEQKLLFITAAKQPPMTPPTFVFSTNASLKENNLYESTFQFAAQYVYEDGENSAISAYSQLAVSPSQFLDGIITEENKLQNNTLTVSVPTSYGDVKSILILARNGNDGAFYEVGKVANDSTTSSVGIAFTNSKLYSAVSQDTVNKLYDNVPQTAESQAITGNRLVYGGYKEGYGNVRTDVSIFANYYPNPGENDVSIIYPSANPYAPGTFVNSWFSIDVSNIPAITTEESILNISFSLNLGRVNISMYGAYVQWVQTKKATQQDHDFGGIISNITGVNLKASPFSISKTINVSSGTSKSDVIDLIKENIIGFYNVIYDSDITDFGDATQITEIKDLQGTTNDNKWMFFAGSGQIEVFEVDSTATEVIFRLKFLGATLTAKAGYNYNVSGLLTSGANLFGLRQLFTRGAAIGQRYPATNQLFNEIEFIDSPSLIFNGDGNQYTKYTGVSKSGDVLTPTPTGGTISADTYVSPLNRGQEDRDVSVSFEAIFLTYGDVNTYGTYKAGATHSFGMVYYDDRNRSGGVQELQDLYVKYFSDRFLENGLLGRTASVLRVKHDPPSWASKWAPVYAKTTSVTNKLQYSVTNAFVASNLQATEFSGISSLQDTLFLSFRSFEGKSDSYKDAYEVTIDYAYEKGDRVRIVRYAGSSVSTIDVDVLGYFDFTEDITKNPVIDLTGDDGKFNSIGWFLAIKAVSDSGWSNYDVIQGQDNWRNECVIEIYRQNKPASQEIYYEIGKTYPISGGNHVGDRTSVSTFNLSIVDDTDRNNLEVYSNIIAYKGDILTDGAGNTLIVGNVYPEVNGSYNYVFYAATVSGTFSITTYNLNITNSNDAVILLTQGDSYYKPRMLKFGEKAYSNNFKFGFIEAYNVSDIFSSYSSSYGRPNAVQLDATTIFRESSVTYSDPLIIDNKIFGLSSFNPSFANFYDFEYRYGIIKQMVGDDDRVYVIQERKAGWAPIGRNIIESSDGVQMLTVSRNVFGPVNYYLGDFGINNNPESLGVENGRIYFADIRTGKVIRISRDGITPVSEQLMDSYFKENFSLIASSSSRNMIIGGIDVEAGEYIISSDVIFNATATVTDGATAFEYNVQSNNSTGVICEISFDDTNLFTFSTDIRNFNESCDEFNESLNAIVFLDRLVDGQPAYVGEEFIGSSATIYGTATNSTYDFFVTIALNLSTGEFTFTNDCGPFSGSVGAGSELGSDFTVSYDTGNSVWNTQYSYRPEAIESIDDTLYTFKNGLIYKHSTSADRSTYYGVPYDTVIEVVSAQNPSMVKSYESISLEGTASWAASITNTDQSTSILSSDFSERERNWYAYVPRDSSANTGSSTITSLSGSSEIFALGAVESITGSDIKFTSSVGYITFPMGASLYKVSGSSLVSISNTVSSVSNDTITCAAAVSGVIVGDEIIAIGNGAVEGDQMRDYYAKIRLTNDATSEIELYAVNTVYSKSNLANQLGQ